MRNPSHETTVAFLLGWRPSLSEGTLHAEARSLKFLRSDYRESSDPFAGARHIDYLGYSEKIGVVNMSEGDFETEGKHTTLK